MNNQQVGGIPHVTIVGQTAQGQADETLIMFTTPYLNADLTYQAVLDANVVIPPTIGNLVLWCTANDHGPFDGAVSLRVLDITVEEGA